MRAKGTACHQRKRSRAPLPCDPAHQTIWLVCASSAFHASAGRQHTCNCAWQRRRAAAPSSQASAASMGPRYLRRSPTVCSCHSCGGGAPLLLGSSVHQRSTPAQTARWFGCPDTPPASNVATCARRASTAGGWHRRRRQAAGPAAADSRQPRCMRTWQGEKRCTAAATCSATASGVQACCMPSCRRGSSASCTSARCICRG